MVFTFQNKVFHWRNAEVIKKFAGVVQEMDRKDAIKSKCTRKREVLMTHEQLEEQAQYLVDADKTWEDIKNECV